MFLIIGGATKSGTTSLHEYLKAHPDISAGRLKELRFFLDDNYPLSKEKFKQEKIAYKALFEGKNRIMLDSTPDYLYSKNCAKRIKAICGEDVLIVFLLREPVSRFLSWFSYAKQIGEISNSTTIEEFIALQKDDYEECNSQVFNVLRQGLYSLYLKEFYHVFDKNNLSIFEFDELKKNPLKVVATICEKLHASPDVYSSYVFERKNVTVKVRYPFVNKYYFKLQRITRELIRFSPFLIGVGKKMRKYLDKIMNVVNTKGDIDSQTSNNENSIKFLQSYYKSDWSLVKSKYI